MPPLICLLGGSPSPPTHPSTVAHSAMGPFTDQHGTLQHRSSSSPHRNPSIGVFHHAPTFTDSGEHQAAGHGGLRGQLAAPSAWLAGLASFLRSGRRGEAEDTLTFWARGRGTWLSGPTRPQTGLRLWVGRVRFLICEMGIKGTHLPPLNRQRQRLGGPRPLGSCGEEAVHTRQALSFPSLSQPFLFRLCLPWDEGPYKSCI